MSNKQVTLDDWMIERLGDRLRKASIIACRTGRPILLYRNTLEELDQAAEEEIATINEKYVIVQVLTHGGFIAPDVQQQYVFTFDQFPEWIMNRSRDLLLECLECLDQEMLD